MAQHDTGYKLLFAHKEIVRIRNLIRRGEVERGGALPLVLLIVLYNGQRRWRAPTGLRGLLGRMPASFAPYVPLYQFVLLDEGRLNEEDFPVGRNVVAAVFRLERSGSPEELLGAVRLLVSWLREPEQETLRHGIIEWLHRRGESLDPSLDWQSIHSLEEADTMLEDRIKEWKAQYRREGLQEGRQEGSTIEARLILSRLLARRFGALPTEVRERLDQAPLEQLEDWIDRFYDAGSLEQVFH